MKPFTIGFETPLLDEITLTTPEQFATTVPAGKTLRETLRWLHVNHMKHLKAIETQEHALAKKKTNEYVLFTSFKHIQEPSRAGPGGSDGTARNTDLVFLH